MTRERLLKSSAYWVANIQIALYQCAEKFMRKNRMNRSQLAKHLGVSNGYVSQLLNGNYDHKLSKVVDLALAFGYVPDFKFIPIEEMIAYDKITSYSFKYSGNNYAIEDKGIRDATERSATLNVSDNYLTLPANNNNFKISA